MNSSTPEFTRLVKKSLEEMEDKPSRLLSSINHHAAMRDIEFPSPLDWLSSELLDLEEGSELAHALGLGLRRWDRVEVDQWTSGTPPFSQERRALAYKRLELPEALHELLDRKMPVFQSADRPIIIATEHQPWYERRALADSFYWTAYTNYLRQTKGWDTDSVGKLDDSTHEVVKRISDPCRPEIYPSRGLIVGYVQSGKTANFSGVLAKAADAGYRFIVVLAGTLDILRDQTQRRLDKELVGKELVAADYSHEPDWSEFLSHGGKRPSEQGAFDWERLTGPHEDYKELKQAIAALEFKPQIPSKAFNDPANLRHAPLRIIVIKKVPKVLARLARDLGKLHHKLAHVPVLVVDDESDQASINVLDPSKNKPGEKERTSTNREIVDLLKAMPRAQYLGYTATPFANVFVDPSDEEDLFPKDFIISLPRPKGYMGVRDFYDFDEEPEGFESNKAAFVRDVRGNDCGGDFVQGEPNPNHLQRAIDCFVLSGAIKCYRTKVTDGRLKYKHHTMLVHHSVARADHRDMAALVESTFLSAGYYGAAGRARLEQLFTRDFMPVSRVRGEGMPMPAVFSDLLPYIGECLIRLTAQKTVLIVNGENKDDTPDFDRGSVWAILVGGTKLSRGYTVEGLTITYFRRVSTTGDTLMQMGRWFGYRPGYGDLVRLYIGRDEPFGSSGKNRLDLYDAFEAICRDEEKFRHEIQRYKDGTRPRDIPPLVPVHLTTLRPTAKNKMYNARITFKNLGGEWSEPTWAPTDSNDALKNEDLARTLLKAAGLQHCKFSGTKPGKDGQRAPCNVSALCGLTSPSQMLSFLKSYRWDDTRPLLKHELEFIESSEGDPCIDEWIVVLPMADGRSGSEWEAPTKSGTQQIPVQKRGRLGRRFKAYSTSSHRAVAEYLACTTDSFTPTTDQGGGLRNPRRGTLLMYPIKDTHESFVSIGFAILFPKNNIRRQIMYEVKDPSRPEAVVVPLDDDDNG